jgi:oxygen-independent coproporphyrinogen-3 oxidase
MHAAALQRYDAQVPRYTSYPTAPHFASSVDAARYATWLEALEPSRRLSLYLHVPFCQQLCWFCGCHTQATRRREPIKRYAETLAAEMDLVAECLGARRCASHIHFGGGSPSVLTADDWCLLLGRLRDRFDLTEDAEIAVEIDPRTLTDEQSTVLAALGVTRVSVGVQDFDDDVQRGINRVQSYELTRSVVDRLRAGGVKGINIDLMYGLPHQTSDSIACTIEKALTLAPDRLALFGYAHVPWFKHHQKLIDESALPDSDARLAQFETATRLLMNAGYVWIGLDHFARPDDSLACALAARTLRRNFQGYTDDATTALLGFGASAIGALPQGYVQNETGTRDYTEKIVQGVFAVQRGIELSAEDRFRGEIIEALMCQLAVDLNAVCARHDRDPAQLREAHAALSPMAHDGLVRMNDGRVEITPEGRPALRIVCAAFDHYLQKSRRPHSRAV